MNHRWLAIHRSAIVAPLLLTLLLAMPGKAEVEPSPGVLFHASFDSDRRAEQAAGDPLPSRGRYADENYTAAGGTIGPGVFGNALSGAGRLGAHDAAANLDPRRGTVAFFLKFRNKPYGFEAFVARTVDNYYWLRYLRNEVKPLPKGDAFQLITSVPDELYRPRSISSGGNPEAPTLRADTWHHIAIAWDQTQGLRTWIDGKPAASTWGQHTWLSHGVDLDFLQLQLDADVSYDELWIFDRALGDAQVLAIKERNQPPAASDLPAIAWDQAAQDHRLAELSWQLGEGAMPRIKAGVTGLGAHAVRQVLARQARAVMNECNIAIDGKLGGGFPALYGYRYAQGNGLHVELTEPADLVLLEGRFHGRVYSPKVLLPQGQAPLDVIQSESFLHRWKPDAPLPAGWVSFFRSTVESPGAGQDKEQLVTGRLNEIGFFKLHEHRLADAKARRYYLGSASNQPLPAELAPAMATAFAPGDRTVLSSGDKMPAAGNQRLEALRYHHILLPAADADRVLSGLRLVLWSRSDPLAGQQLLRLEVRDPDLPMRRLTAIDFAIEPSKDPTRPAALDLTLDLADRIVPAGKPLWLVLCLRRASDLLWLDAAKSCYVDWLSGDAATATAEHVTADLPLVLARFAELASPRPWSGYAVPEVEMPQRYRLGAELFAPLVMIRRLAPEHPTARAIWAWTHKDTVDTSPVQPLTVAAHPDAPRWALLQRELRDRCRDVVQWWIDNRQAPSGEFGDDLNDDTDFIQDYPKHALINHADRRLLDSAHAVVQACIDSGTLTEGITTSPTDPLHAYENGTNALAMALLLDDGDPLYRARAMQAAATVERLLMARDAHGRLRFKSNYFGFNEVRTQGNSGSDTFTNSLMLHPALNLAYLSGHRKAQQVVTDYADGWLAYWNDAAKAREKRLPAATLLDGTVARWDTRVRGYGFASVFLGAWRLTGSDTYRDGLLRWSEPQHARFRGGDALAALEAVDATQYAAQLAAWADQADLARITVDRFGHIARQRYVKFEVQGDEQAAYDALDASLRNIRTLFDAYTLGEPQNDRIYPPDQVMAVMAYGEIPHERNQLWPRHYVSYSGFSDLAAWVRKKSDTQLTVWLYSFADRPQDGQMRFWRTPAGRYRLSVAAPQQPAAEQHVDLHRGQGVNLTLAPGKVYVVELAIEQPSGEDIIARADVAVSRHELRRQPDGSLEARVYNLGNTAVGEVEVALRDANGKIMASTTLAALPAVKDWTAASSVVTFSAQQAGGAAELVLDPQQRLSEQTRRNNTVSITPP